MFHTEQANFDVDQEADMSSYNEGKEVKGDKTWGGRGRSTS
jgi:hypothetical protein